MDKFEILYIIALFVALFVVHGCVWGVRTKKLMKIKGYDGKQWFWFGFLFGYWGYMHAAEKEDKITHHHSDADTLHRGGWRCKSCGRINSSYTGTCACGKEKE